MKTLACLLSALLFSLNGLLTPPPTQPSILLFLSLRMKGNGDGTIMAVAQNEFTIGACSFPVTLSFYTAAEYTTDVDKMTLVDSVSNDDLNLFESMTITHTVENAGYFCAVVSFTVNGEVKEQKCDTIYYDTDGIRK